MSMSPCVILCTGLVLDLKKSLHNQGIQEKEQVLLVYDPPSTEDDIILKPVDPAKTEGSITRSESVISSDVWN